MARKAILWILTFSKPHPKQPGTIYYSFYIHSYESVKGRKERSKSTCSVAHKHNNSFSLLFLWVPREKVSSPLQTVPSLATLCSINTLGHLWCQRPVTCRSCPALWACFETRTCTSLLIFHYTYFSFTQTVVYTKHIFLIKDSYMWPLLPPPPLLLFRWPLRQTEQDFGE